VSPLGSDELLARQFIWGEMTEIKSNDLRLVALLALGALSLLVGLERVGARQLVLVPNADRLRFQLIGNEPIAGPDGRALVRGWSVLLFRDRKADRCYIVFKHEVGIAAEEATICPQWPCSADEGLATLLSWVHVIVIGQVRDGSSR
jgi:hypothetical protein